jgi:hypothetical protein
MASGDIISAARYNAMQTAVTQVLGNGADTFGYGQVLSSTSVAPTATVDATHMQRLKTDLVDIFAHQNGAIPTLLSIAAGADISDSSYVQYESVTSGITGAARFNIDSAEGTTSALASSTRNTSWNGTITHEFSITFTSADARRHFFNSGGEIRFGAQLLAPSDAKSSAWSSFLSSMQSVIFNYTTSVSTASITTDTSASIGNFDLVNDAAYVQIYTNSKTTGYSDTFYNISARATSNSLRFLVEFIDGPGATGPGGSIDENVTGSITSSISQFRATGAYVSVPSPVFSNISAIST